MNIVIPMAGRVRMCIRSSYVAAQRTDAVHYNLTGESFNLMEVFRHYCERNSRGVPRI